MTTFKTITLGTKTKEEYIKALEKNFKLGSYAKQILESDKFTVAKNEIKVDLVVMSVSDLGFTEATPLREIYARANELGLDLCPSEVGLELRMEYRNQTMDEWIAIAMEHLPDANGDLSVFRVGRDGGGLWLYADWDALGRTWHPEARFVFVPRKQPLTAGSLSGLENPSDTVTLEFKNKEELVNVLKYRLEAEVTKYRRADWMDDETFILDITAKIVSQLTYSYKKV